MCKLCRFFYVKLLLYKFHWGVVQYSFCCICLCVCVLYWVVRMDQSSIEMKEMEVNDCILEEKNNSYKDFIAIVEDEFMGSRALCISNVKHLFIHYLPKEEEEQKRLSKRVNLFARQFGDRTESFVALSMQSFIFEKILFIWTLNISLACTMSSECCVKVWNEDENNTHTYKKNRKQQQTNEFKYFQMLAIFVCRRRNNLCDIFDITFCIFVVAW